MKPNYNLTFEEALSQIFDKKMFIRGDDFAEGIYLKVVDGVLTMIDGNRLSQPIGNFIISIGTYNQKYKAFSVANNANVND